MQVPISRDCYDHSIFGENSFFTYECVVCGRGANALSFCADCWVNVRELEYCLYCTSSSNLFGCVGLRNKTHCILNKQYSKEEFGRLKKKIIQHMKEMPYKDKEGRVYRYGEFFPIEFSPFPYNQSVAQEHFSLSQEKAKRQGYSWLEPEEKNYTPTLSWKDLPDSIEEADDSITKELILCKEWDEEREGAQEQNCTKVFRIIPAELALYRKFGIALPRMCHQSRHVERLRERNSFKLYHRTCHCAGKTPDNYTYKNTIDHFHGQEHCPNTFETAYPPDSSEIVYCEQCYNQEVA